MSVFADAASAITCTGTSPRCRREPGSVRAQRRIDLEDKPNRSASAQAMPARTAHLNLGDYLYVRSR